MTKGEVWNISLGCFARELGRDSVQYRNVKRAAKKALNSGEAVFPSLLESSRAQYDNDNGDGWVEYGYFDGADMTDDDIREYIDEYIRVRPPYSMYDCTGRAFTWLVDWHRNPSGLISYRNHMALDV